MSGVEKQPHVSMGALGPSATAAAHGTPGKRTRVEQALVPVQLRASAARDEGAIQAAAAQGVATPASPLPHGETIQRLFGRHDISSVQAHVGPEAAAAAGAMGADAYATGNHVVLGKGTDLGTVAHEAAHVVQQRGGVQLKGGVGQQGDAHEQHADEVSARVVEGKSAEGLLDRYAGGGGAGAASGGAGPIQLKLSVAGKDEPDVEAVWGRILGMPELQGIEGPAKELLAKWITREAAYGDASQVSENRAYPGDAQLARALAGDVRAAKNLAHEGKLAQRTIDEGHVNGVLGGFVEKLKKLQATSGEAMPSSAKGGRYGGWTYPAGPVGKSLDQAPEDLRGRISLIADYALVCRGDIKKLQGGWNFQMPAELDESRATHWNTNEDAPWVQKARESNAPLSAGPSATTAQVLALASAVQATVEEMTALAWALFALWNGMPLHKTGTHRFHEVMAVAVQYGVPYEAFQYADPPSGQQSI